MVALTPNFSWNLPEVNSVTDQDLWGGYLNANISSQDTYLKSPYDFAYDLGNISGAVSVSLANGLYQYGTVNGNITSLTVSDWPASGKEGFVTLELNQDGTGGRTIAFSSAYKTPGGVAITLSTTASAKDVLYLRTRDAGTTILTDFTANYA